MIIYKIENSWNFQFSKLEDLEIMLFFKIEPFHEFDDF